MGNPYPQLVYPGDITDWQMAQPGHLLGCDEVGRFYEVIDAELGGVDGECAVCGPGRELHTHVNLQYATAETLKRAAGRSED